jgi:hypothetical protein
MRAKDIAKRASKNIKKIIIDGNNMCYEGNRFVGINPIKCILGLLENKYEVVIIFDASILKHSNISRKYVNSVFSGSNIYIVNTGYMADETIIKLTLDDETSYILSNDRFSEFSSESVIVDSRLIKHDVVDGQVLINDLDIQAKYKCG